MLKTLTFKERLERGQIAIYVAALTIEASLELASPEAGSSLESTIYPVLGVLLYATFSQIPFAEFRTAFSGGRFLPATLAVNFLAVPAVVWVFSRFVSGEPAVLFCVLLVLLTPQPVDRAPALTMLRTTKW